MPWLPISAAVVLTLRSPWSVLLDDQAERLPDSKLSAKIRSDPFDVLVGVGVRVAVGVGVLVGVGEGPILVAVAVGVRVGVFVGLLGVLVEVLVGVLVALFVGVFRSESTV